MNTLQRWLMQLRHAALAALLAWATPLASALEIPLHIDFTTAPFNSPEEALAAFHRGQFAPLPPAPAQLGWGERPVWLLAQAQRPWSDISDGHLTLGPMPVATMQAWRVDPDSGALSTIGVSGVTADFNTQTLAVPGLATLALSGMSGQQWVLVRVQATGLTVVDLVARDAPAYADFSYWAGLGLGLLACYFIIYWAISISVTRLTALHSVLLWTVLMTLCAAFLAMLNGCLPLSWPGSDPRVLGWLWTAMISLLIMLLTWLMLPILQVSQYVPKWTLPLKLSVLAFIPAALLGEWLMGSSLAGVLLWHSVQVLLMLHVGRLRWSMLIADVRTTSYAALALVLALEWLYASLLGWVPLTWWAFISWQVAIVMGMLYALAKSLTGNFTERRLIQVEHDRLHELVQKEKQQLELRVQERTAELQEALSEVQRFESQQRELLSLASHEFRTPAAIIKSSLEVVDQLPQSVSDAAGPFMESVRVASDRLIFLANKLIEHDRWREMSLKPRLERLELRRWTAEVVGEIPLSQGVYADLCETAVVVQADTVLLRIALQNLIDNALAHNKRIGHVIVRLRWDDAQVQLIVDDQGKGVPNAHKAQVFERFFSERSGQSHGLGLSIVRSVARLHGGEASVADAPGGGARFVISLPR